jgi:hypothetical protein
MFQIPTLGLFLTCTENSFLFEHTYVFKQERIYLLIKKQKPSYLGRKSFFHGSGHPLRSFAQSQLPCAPFVFPHPGAHFPHTEHLFLHTKTT